MLTRDTWRVVGMGALGAWAVSLLLPGWGGWLALPFCALWLTAVVLSLPRPAFGGRNRMVRRFRRNLKWLPGNTLFAALVAVAGWWLLPVIGPSGWSAVAFGLVWPPLAMWLMATGRLGLEQRVEVDDDDVRVLEDGEVVQRLGWVDLEQVAVVTTAAGPWDEDMFWVLSTAGDGAGVVVPHGLAVDEVVPRLLQLANLDKDRLVESLGSASQATFILWRRDTSDASEPPAVG